MKLYRIEFNGEVNRRYAYVIADDNKDAEKKFRSVFGSQYIFSNVCMPHDMVVM